MQSLYTSGAYLEQNPTWHAEDSPWKAAQVLKMLRRHGLAPATVCEVGCGAGEILVELQRALGGGGKGGSGAEATGVGAGATTFTGYELSPQAFELCRPRENEHLHFHLRDLLEEGEARFDLVLAIDVFEHIPDYMGFLQKLRPKGEHHLFHIPLELCVWNLLRAHCLMVGRRKVGHLHYFSRETALATLEDCGYEVVDHFFTPGSFELPNVPPAQRVLNIPRHIVRPFSPALAARLFGGSSLLVLTH